MGTSMMRMLVAIVVVGVLATPGAATAAGTGPALSVEPDCEQTAGGEQVYGFLATVTGLAPNAQFSAKVDFTYIDPPVNPDGSQSTGGSAGPATFTADADGSFGPIGFGTVGVKTIYTVIIEYAGQTLAKTVTVTCLPTSKDECKNGGWRDFPEFENQGDCVSFVATGGKNPPAG
jgi:hypothetical protein